MRKLQLIKVLVKPFFIFCKILFQKISSRTKDVQNAFRLPVRKALLKIVLNFELSVATGDATSTAACDIKISLNRLPVIKRVRFKNSLA
jgi:hypothetical protein